MLQTGTATPMDCCNSSFMMETVREQQEKEVDREIKHSTLDHKGMRVLEPKPYTFLFMQRSQKGLISVHVQKQPRMMAAA